MEFRGQQLFLLALYELIHRKQMTKNSTKKMMNFSRLINVLKSYTFEIHTLHFYRKFQAVLSVADDIFNRDSKKISVLSKLFISVQTCLTELLFKIGHSVSYINLDANQPWRRWGFGVRWRWMRIYNRMLNFKINAKYLLKLFESNGLFCCYKGCWFLLYLACNSSTVERADGVAPNLRCVTFITAKLRLR